MTRTIAVLAAFCMVWCAGTARSEGGPEIKWVRGPAAADLGKNASLDVPAGYVFANGDDSRVLLKAMGNLITKREEGLLAPVSAIEGEGGSAWFVVFEFNPTGYVKDDEKGSIDAAALLASLKEGNAKANKERERQKLEKLELTGWAVEPHYNQETNNLEWGLLLQDEKGGKTVNYNVRLLGRKGVMECTLVLSEDQLNRVLPAFRAVLGGYGFKTGEKYAEYKPGDKLAKYGLTALIAGGALAAAAKTGLLQKFWKFLVLIVIGLAAWFKKIWNRLFGKEYAGARVEEPKREEPKHGEDGRDGTA